MRITAGRVYLLNAALIAAFFAVSAAAFHRLPATIPIHFGWSGSADAWTGTSLLSWFGLPFFAAACGASIYLLSRLGRRKPGMYNLPRKREFLALSAGSREEVLSILDVFLAWLSVAVTLETVAVQFSVFSTATGRTEGLSLATVLALVVGTAALGIGGALHFQRVDERISTLSRQEDADQVRL